MPKVEVTIKLYGILRADVVQRELLLKANTLQDVFEQLVDLGIDRKLLRGALVFINDAPLSGALRRKHQLERGDTIALLSPAGGG